MGFAEKFAEKFIAFLNTMTPDLRSLYASSHRQALGDWHAKQVAMVAATGAGSTLVPGYHLAAMAADIAFVGNRLGVAGHGVGAILGYGAGHGDILDDNDMAAIVLYWVGADDFRTAMQQAALGRGTAGVMPLVGSNPTAVKAGIKTMMHSLGYLAGTKVTGKAGAKLGGKVAGKVAAKMTVKMSSKALLGFVPILGAVVGGGVNAWIVDGMLEAAKEYYRDKIRLLGSGGATASLPAAG